MTVEEWNKLRAGMRIVDHHHGDAIRTIIKISRVKSENGRGLTRTGLTVTNLKSNDRKAHTIIFASENTGPSSTTRAAAAARTSARTSADEDRRHRAADGRRADVVHGYPHSRRSPVGAARSHAAWRHQAVPAVSSGEVLGPDAHSPRGRHPVKLPDVELVNRFGLPFGRSRRTTTYATSGRNFADYYTFVCLRCGWAFCKPRHLNHRLDACNLVLLQLANGDRDMLAFVKENLFGTKARRR
jgi:hypothetical protein